VVGERAIRLQELTARHVSTQRFKHLGKPAAAAAAAAAAAGNHTVMQV
jgi:hypothetical protein